MARHISTAARCGFMEFFFPFSLFFLILSQGKDFWCEAEGDPSCCVPEAIMEQVRVKHVWSQLFTVYSGSLVHLSWDALKGISLSVGSWPSWISQNFCSVPGTALNTGKWMEPFRLQAALLHLSVWLPLGTAGWKWRRKRRQCLLIKLQTAISNKGMGTPLWSMHCLGFCNVKHNYVAVT